MALINCPECGKEISDKAHACPHCGNPIASVPPPLNLSAPVQPAPVAPTPANTGFGNKPSAPQVGIDTQKLKCPYCGEVLGPKDILSSGWAKCPTCGETIRLTGANGEYDDNVLIERISPFKFTKEEYHNIFMQQIMDLSGVNLFDQMRMISLKRKFFWVREFGRANDRVIYPMCQYGKDLFMRMPDGTPWLKMEDYEKYFPTEYMVPFNSDDLRDTESVPKEMSAAEIKLEFSHTVVGKLDPTPNYYCLPVVEEVVEYEGQQYTFIGTAGAENYWFCSDFSFTPMPKPNYTHMQPVLITVWAIIAIALLIPISIGFIQSFWGTFFSLIGIAIVGALLSGVLTVVVGAISAIPIGIDTLICKSINKKRRKAFRQEYANMQETKKQSAKQRMNAEVTYEVPEFPIP